ncbi:MAG: sugar phosphate isomerase/epimerase family protein [Anaerolineales bacterium]
MRRREFVGAIGAVGAGFIPPLPVCAPAPDRRRSPSIGLELYTVRSLMAKDVEGTLAAVAEIGYREVEFAGEFGRSPGELRRTLDRLGLRAPARHVPVESLDGGWPEVLEDSAAMGCAYAVVAWIPEGMRRTLDDWRRWGERFNGAGQAARRAGLRFAYHNHDFEFGELEGRIPFDVLLEATDATLVAIELDLYWITKGGQDPLVYLGRERGRYALTHVKDMDPTPARGMADPGKGIIDFPRILPVAREAGVRHYFVEHDNPGDPLATARAGFEYLSRVMR